MKALFIILNDLDYLEDILEEFVSLDIKGATVLDSQGLAQAILGSESGSKLFFNGPFQRNLADQGRNNKTIFTVLKKEKVESVVKAIREIVNPSKKPAIGFMFSVPVDDIFLLKPHK